VWQTEEEPEEDLLTMIIRVYLDYLNVPADTIPELIKRIRKKLSQQPAGKQDIAVPQNLRAALWRLLTVYHSEHVEEALNTIDTQPLKIKQQPWYRELLEKIKEVQTDTEVKSKIAKIIKSLPPEESGAQNLASAV